MGLYGFFYSATMGLSMGAVGFCGYYGAYGLTWSPLDLYGALYGRYGLLWVPWVDLASSESLWASMGSSIVPLWGSMCAVGLTEGPMG